MADLAQVEDIVRRWRPLRGQEITNAASYISDASETLREEISDVDARVTASTSYARNVTKVISFAVIRMLRGQDRNDPADYSSIFFTRGELSMLAGGVGGRVSSMVLTNPLSNEPDVA